jgi:hypothetical protein
LPRLGIAVISTADILARPEHQWYEKNKIKFTGDHAAVHDGIAEDLKQAIAAESEPTPSVDGSDARPAEANTDAATPDANPAEAASDVFRSNADATSTTASDEGLRP